VEAGAGMSGVATLASVSSDFSDAIDFIFHKRESVSGGIQVGGPHELLTLAGTHMRISLIAVALACAVSIPLGLYLGHIGRGEFLAISVSNIGRAVPSLALLAFFVAYIGLGDLNIITVLFLLAVPPILTNTYVATRQVDRNTVDAARGLGMSERQIVRKVELPLGLATIFGGIRTSTVNVVATATIAPLANVKTLGYPIINTNVYGFSGTLGAAIVVALLTLFLDGLLAYVQRLVTPRGIKIRAAGGAAPRRGKFFAMRTPREGQA
jgi:osmoprotectant transport system permease protein